MPLHPKLEKLLANWNRSDPQPVDQVPVAESRQLMLDTSRLLGPFPAIHAVQDVVCPGQAGKLALRVYRPAEEPLPVVVYFHGGGWVIGSIDSHDGYARSLANATGSVVVSVDYRLAPEHPFPAAAEDAYAATRWIAENAPALGGQPGPIGVSGDSAGGNLAAAVALMARDRNGPDIGCQILLYPITDHDFDTPSYHECAEGYFLTRSAMFWFWDQYCPKVLDRSHPYVSPLRAESLVGLPPALTITAEYDPLRDEAEAYAARLTAEGVDSRCVRYDGMIHGFTRRFHLLEEAHQAMQETAAWIQTHLH